MNGDSLSPLLVAFSFFTVQMGRWVVWSGLVALTVALLVLMRTRWGQSNPLRKCIVLSLLVHLLFGIYLTTINIVSGDGGGLGKGSALRVSLLGEGSEDGSSAADGDSPDAPLDPFNSVASRPPSDVPDEMLPGLPRAAIAAPDEELPPPQIEKLPLAGVKPRQPNASDVPPPDPSRDPREGGVAQRETSHPDAQPNAANAGDSMAASGDGPGGLVPIPKSPEGPPGTLAAQASAGSDGENGHGYRIPRIYEGRIQGNRGRAAAAGGGSKDTEAAVEEALDYLARRQSPVGNWNPRALEGGRAGVVEGQDRSGAGSRAETGVTGLALLAFLAAGNTHESGARQKNVRAGMEYLLSIQAADGDLCGEATFYDRMYCHAMATCALSEDYAMTGDKRMEKAVRAAIAYTLAAQDPRGGGWRYQNGQEGDTSQLGWQVMSLKSAELAGITMPDTTRAGVARYLSTVASGRSGGLASYRPGHPVSAPMTAEALVCREFMGLGRDRAAGAEAAQYIARQLPGQGQANVYYWYYGTLGMHLLQGPEWERWNTALQNALLKTQRTDGEMAGSWDPDPVWGIYGGRAYSTALGALCFEVYYRYLPLHVEAAARDNRAK